MSSNITVKDSGGACWITISREKKANALMADDCAAIRRYVEEATAKTETKAIVFTGAGERALTWVRRPDQAPPRAAWRKRRRHSAGSRLRT